MGQVAFFVKDAPSDDFSSVNVTFSKVEIHAAGGDEDANETESPANETTAPSGANATSPTASNSTSSAPANHTGRSSWIVIVNTTHTVDLKAFQGDLRSFLGSADVPAGTYTQIRIHVDSVVGSDNGTEVNISLPSHTLKVVRTWSVDAGKQTNLTVDFDLSKSILQTGNGEYKLKPTLKLAVERGEIPDGTGTDDAASRHGPKTNNTHTIREEGPA